MPNICGGKLKYGNTKTQLCLCRLRVETYIWDLYKTKHFQFYTDIHAKHLGGGYIFLKYHRAEPQFLFSFWYRNINIPKYDIADSSKQEIKYNFWTRQEIIWTCSAEKQVTAINAAQELIDAIEKTYDVNLNADFWES